MALTSRQQKFVEAYAGNGTAACRAAGYRGDDHVLATQARRLLRNDEVATAIRQRQAPESANRIATRERRQEFWTSTMDDETRDIHARLKASELLGRSQTDFVERRVEDKKVTIQVVNPFAVPK